MKTQKLNLQPILVGNVLKIVEEETKEVIFKYSFERFRSIVEQSGSNFDDVVNNWITAICNNLNLGGVIDDEGVPVIL